MTSHRNYQWLRNLITGDEKWVLYVNHTRKRQWLGAGQTGVATPKHDLLTKEDYAERLVGSKRNYSLGTSSN